MEAPDGGGPALSKSKVGGCPKGRSGVGGHNLRVGEDGGHPFVNRLMPYVHDHYPEVAVVLGGQAG